MALLSGKRTVATLLALIFTGLTATAVEQSKVQVHRVLPHDPQAFTQGFCGGTASSTRAWASAASLNCARIDPDTGAVERRGADPRVLLRRRAGAGRRTVGDAHLAGTTGRSCFNRDSFAKLGTFTYQGEGWGLCHDGARFVMSDGSSKLTFRDSASFAFAGAVEATLDGVPLARLNELECVADGVYANVWQRDFIVRIDPTSGRVTQRIDASGLLDAAAAPAAGVLNGIAYNPESQRFYITGKRWPALFEVTFDAE